MLSVMEKSSWLYTGMGPRQIQDKLFVFVPFQKLLCGRLIKFSTAVIIPAMRLYQSFNMFKLGFTEKFTEHSICIRGT